MTAQAQSTELIRDFTPEGCCDYIYKFVKSGDHVYFAKGPMLWKTDGTSHNTTVVTDKLRVPTWPLDSTMVDLNDVLYFTASDTINPYNYELWKTDGTEEGTMLVKEIRSGSQGSYPTDLVNLDGTLFFIASDEHGSALFKSDGTKEGTIKIKNIGFTVNDGFFTQVGDQVFFYGNNSSGTRALWRTDGTNEGTSVLKADNVGYSGSLVNYQNELFFSLYGNNQGRLWKSNGTVEGTTEVMTFDHSSLGNFVVMNGLLYFIQYSGSKQYSLWRSDGTASGTEVVIANINICYNGTHSNLYAQDNSIYMVVQEENKQLWKSDGTTEGTYMIKDGFDYLSDFYTANGFLYYSAREIDQEYATIWKSDGTVDGTTSVANIEDYTSIKLVNSLNSELILLVGNPYQSIWRYDTGIRNTPPLSKDTTISLLANQLFHFTSKTFPFADYDTEYEFKKVKISNSVQNGVLFVDHNQNQLSEPEEIVLQNTIVEKTNFSKLVFSPEKSNYSDNYAHFTFAVSDGYDYSEEHTMTVNVRPHNKSQSITWNKIDNSLVGDSLILSASASSALPVSYTVVGPAMTIDSLLVIEGVGEITVTATQGGNEVYLEAKPITQTFYALDTFTLKSQSITWAQIDDLMVGDTLLLSATASSGLPIRYTVTGPAIIHDDNKLVATETGTATITAMQAGNDAYQAAESMSQELNIDSIVTGIIDRDVSFAAYPNPTNNQLIIRLDNPGEYGAQVTITDLLGNTIRSTTLKAQFTYFDISQQIPGVYLMTVHSKNQTRTFRILKQ